MIGNFLYSLFISVITSSDNTTSIPSKIFFNCKSSVAPKIIEPIKGLWLQKAKDICTGSKLYFFARLIYSFTAGVELSLILPNKLGTLDSLEFLGMLLSKYFPVKNPPANGEYANKPIFSWWESSAISKSYNLQSKLYSFWIEALLPEIFLTNEFKSRFEDFFGYEPAIWHSKITPKNKRIIWKGIIENKIKLIVGARSALLLPFKKLGLIVVDEEHDASYKQVEGVIYNARDMAISRASFEKIPIHLVTSIPSIETYNNIQNKKFRHVKIVKRFNDYPLPKTKIINLHINKVKDKFISDETILYVNIFLKKKEQILFFINRRGFAPYLICQKCGFKQVCSISFRRNFLIKYLRMKETTLEKLESIDMLRILENGFPVKLVEIKGKIQSVDTKKDLIKVNKILQKI